MGTMSVCPSQLNVQNALALLQRSGHPPCTLTPRPPPGEDYQGSGPLWALLKAWSHGRTLFCLESAVTRGPPLLPLMDTFRLQALRGNRTQVSQTSARSTECEEKGS
ncbi:unnamed protein product [Boreogadus saida]